MDIKHSHIYNVFIFLVQKFNIFQHLVLTKMTMTTGLAIGGEPGGGAGARTDTEGPWS